MEKHIGKFSDVAYALLRVVSGLMFACHGFQKVFGMFGGEKLPLTSFYGFGGLLELVLGLMIALGVFTGWAAFLASGEMAVAYFMSHFPKGFLPIVNKGELAVVYCFLFLYIATRGSGRFGLTRR